MKLIRFTTADSPNPCFGVVVRDQAVPFAVLQSKAGKSSPHLADSRSYLANLPDSERAAKELLAWGEQHLGELGKGERFPLNAVCLLEPVEVVALFDFGLTPRHLKNSCDTCMKYEKDNPQTAPLLQAFAKAVLAPKPKPVPGRPEPLPFYKSNMNAIVSLANGNLGQAILLPLLADDTLVRLSRDVIAPFYPYFSDTVAQRAQDIDKAKEYLAKCKYKPEEMIDGLMSTGDVGHWQTLKRNLLQDFERAFGEPPGALVSIGVMTDSDNTESETEAHYGDLSLLSVRGLAL